MLPSSIFVTALRLARGITRTASVIVCGPGSFTSQSLHDYVGENVSAKLFGQQVPVSTPFVANRRVGRTRTHVVGRLRVGVTIQCGRVDRDGVAEIRMVSALCRRERVIGAPEGDVVEQGQL